MSIDSISLIAQTAYAKTINQPVTENIKEAVNFQDMVKASFNSFANMSPDQILSRINSARVGSSDPVAAVANTGYAGQAIGDLRKKLNNNDQVIRKSLIGEASLLDVVSTTNEAKNTLQVMVSVRDEFIKAFDSVMSTQF